MASQMYEAKGTNTVILKDRARLVIEEQVADALPDGRFVIGDADVIVFDSKLRGGCKGVVAWYLKRVADAFYIFLCATYPAQRRVGKLGALTLRYCRVLVHSKLGWRWGIPTMRTSAT